jgi:hypothetical protein
MVLLAHIAPEFKQEAPTGEHRKADGTVRSVAALSVTDGHQVDRSVHNVRGLAALLLVERLKSVQVISCPLPQPPYGNSVPRRGPVGR